jgi:tripartite-type tricarboxylate transporter receptor subunit TctC
VPQPDWKEITINRSFIRHAVSLAIVSGMLAAPALHAEYPEKPVRLIVPFSPGGGTDIQARLIGAKMHESTGQTIVIDNRTGAGGLIGAQIAVDSEPDGYTILFTTATIAVNTTLFGKRMKFSAVRDLAPVSWVSSAPLVLVVHPGVPAKSVKELVAIARKQPGSLDIGVNTPGSTSHLSAEMLKQMAKVDGIIVPFRGGGPAVRAVIAGEVDMLFATAPSAMPHIRAGKLRALAVTTRKKSSAFPDLPTMNSVYPGFESDNWYAMFFPARTPRAMVERIYAEIARALKARDVQDFYAREGLDPVASAPEELSELLKREIKKYALIIRRGKIRL